MLPFGIVAAVSLIFAGVLAVQAWEARRQEQHMLEAVGVRVREEDLPLEE